MVVVALTRRVPTSQAARYLDRTLSLDERLTTLLELARKMPVQGLSPARSSVRIPPGLLADTAFELNKQAARMPRFAAPKMEKRYWLALAAATGLLIACVFIPTALDANVQSALKSNSLSTGNWLTSSK